MPGRTTLPARPSPFRKTGITHTTRRLATSRGQLPEPDLPAARKIARRSALQVGSIPDVDMVGRSPSIHDEDDSLLSDEVGARDVLVLLHCSDDSCLGRQPVRQFLGPEHMARRVVEVPVALCAGERREVDARALERDTHPDCALIGEVRRVARTAWIRMTIPE